ncbi:MAG TPA: hypothetical protein VMV39_00070 [Terracidiphilus sp.]|nr:hypothetical protein [Terracidiphilus sp.]
MHLNFAFNAVQILWTLTFAAHLVLLVVLLGRDRASRFPWFTIAIALVALRLVSSRLLYGRLPAITMNAIFIALADLSAVAGLMVVVEVARRSFGRAQRRTWMVWSAALVVLSGGVLAGWGPWPAWKSMTPDTPLAVLGLMQLLAQKTGLLVDVLTVALGLLVLLFGRRYGAGWRSHAQQLVIGLSTASLGQIAVQVIWQIIARTAAPHSQAEYMRIVGLREKLFNANSALYVAVLIWWIVCLWMDEPGAALRAEQLPVGEGAVPQEATAPTAKHSGGSQV